MNDKPESTPIHGDSDELVPHEAHDAMEASFPLDPDEVAPKEVQVEEPFDLPQDDVYRELVRSEPRRFAAMVVIVGVTFLAAGHMLRQPAFMTANDISRWCTVWSLLEHGTYAIDECPWQIETQDKIKWPTPKQLIVVEQKAKAEEPRRSPRRTSIRASRR